MLRPHIHIPPPRTPIGTNDLVRRAGALSNQEAVTRLLRAHRALPNQHEIPAGPVHPDRCCVYCGHDLYVPPKAEIVRCPVCTRELSVHNILLRSDLAKTDPIVTAGKITVDFCGRVAADLVACTIEVSGKLLGDILASRACRIRCTAKVSGRILCRHLTIEPGAEVDGFVEIITDPPLEPS